MKTITITQSQSDYLAHLASQKARAEGELNAALTAVLRAQPDFHPDWVVAGVDGTTLTIQEKAPA